MRVLVDADSFPNLRHIINLCEKYNQDIRVYMDMNHVFGSSYGEVVFVDPGANAVDLYIQNEVKAGDLVLTGDYGVALICLAKGALVLNQFGVDYSSDSIDSMIEFKNENRKRKYKGSKQMKKRTMEDKERLLNRIEEIIK